MKLKFVVVVLVLALSLSLVYLSSVTKESVDDHRFAISNDISKADKSAFSKLKGNFGKAAAEQIISKNIKQDHKHNKDCTCSLNRINPDKYLNAGIAGSEKIQMDDIPESNLREDILLLDPVIADIAFSKLSNLGHEIVLQDLSHIRVDRRGGIFYACPLPEDYQEVSKIDPTIIDLSLSPTSTPPVYNSKPDATLHIYLDFNGATVTGTSWNSGSETWNCRAWDEDGNYDSFSASEQVKIKEMWQKVAEDFAPFNVNVTTDTTYDPDNNSGPLSNVGWCLITETTDSNSADLPHKGYGGIAYLNSFGSSTLTPAWVTGTMSSSNIAEASSHEMGHVFGLSHDGTSSLSYYSGHSNGSISWGPIMGASYGRQVTQWSKGDYYDANNTQNDLTVISQTLPYRTDDYGDTTSDATVISDSGGSISLEGVIETTDDPDAFRFTTGSGAISFTVTPETLDSSSVAGNLDVLLELYDSGNNLLDSNNPTSSQDASISYTATAGDYYIIVKSTGVGSPLNLTPTGYTSYNSMGQYTLTGTVVSTSQLTLTSLDSGGSVFANTDVAITWVSNLGGNVKLELLKDDSVLSTITSSTTNDGSYTWSTGAIYGNDYKIRISSVETPASTYTSSANFTILPPAPLYANMDSDPGWTLDSGWAFGQPTGGEQDGRGGADPTSGSSGANVIGYNLSGDYEQFSSTRWATTQAIDCSDYSNVTLSFDRWLGVERRPYDYAYIEVSNNSSTWTTVWENSTSHVDDSAWSTVQYDISSVADGQSTVYVRWGLGETDGSWHYCGWNLDEVIVSGDFNPTNLSAELTSHSSGANLSGDTVTFTWNAGPSGSTYEYYLGSTAGASDLGSGTTSSTSVTITRPQTSSNIYFTLYTIYNGVRNVNSYNFTNDVGPAVLIPRYRLYNPNSGFHFWTTDANEDAYLGSIGWNQEGANYQLYSGEETINSETSSQYYRLYNPNSGRHFWTSNVSENSYLGSIGWNQEGINGYLFLATVTNSIPLYRLYNPNSGGHFWTVNEAEYNYLGSIGWNQEGIAGYVFNN